MGVNGWPALMTNDGPWDEIEDDKEEIEGIISRIEFVSHGYNGMMTALYFNDGRVRAVRHIHDYLKIGGKYKFKIRNTGTVDIPGEIKAIKPEGDKDWKRIWG